jgi:hypothetical protein
MLRRLRDNKRAKRLHERYVGTKTTQVHPSERNIQNCSEEKYNSLGGYMTFEPGNASSLLTVRDLLRCTVQ